MSFLVGFDWLCVVLFEGSSPLKNCLNFDGLSRQETIGHHFPLNFFKFGHSNEAFTYIPFCPKYLHFSSLSKQKFFYRSFKVQQSRENFFKSAILLTSFEKLSLKKCLLEKISIEKMISISHQQYRYIRIFL